MPGSIADKVMSSLNNPRVRDALMGAGIGAGGGLIGSAFLRKKRDGGNYLKDALMGAALGGGAGAFKNELKGLYDKHSGSGGKKAQPAAPEALPPPPPPPKAKRDGMQNIMNWTLGAKGALGGAGVAGGLGGLGLGAPGLLLALPGAYLGGKAGGRVADWFTGYER